MEEAEKLCDRLGIFAEGELRCLGTPSALARRFGGIFLLTVSATENNEMEASALVAEACPQMRITYQLGGTLKIELPMANTRLSKVFAVMSQGSKRGLVSAWGITSCTLEDAFIKIAQANCAPSIYTPEQGSQKCAQEGEADTVSEPFIEPAADTETDAGPLICVDADVSLGTVLEPPLEPVVDTGFVQVK